MIMNIPLLPRRNKLPPWLSFPWQIRMDGNFIKYIWRLLSWMETCKKISSCLNHKVLLWRNMNKRKQTHQILIWHKTSTSRPYANLIENLLKLNFKHFNLDNETLLVKKIGKTMIYLMVHIDELLIRRTKIILYP